MTNGIRGNVDTITGEQFLAELFEYEYCENCGNDQYGHQAIVLDLGAYGTNWFALCLQPPYFAGPDFVQVYPACPISARGTHTIWVDDDGDQHGNPRDEAGNPPGRILEARYA